MPSMDRHNGEVTIDHRASPGYTPEQARVSGYVGLAVGEGQVTSLPTLGCPHCGGVQLMNPHRTRPREYCKICDKRICDFCHAFRCEPDYVHRTVQDIIEAIKSGKYTLAPGPASRPRLIPTGATSNV